MLTEKLKCLLGRIENIVGKEENAGYQHFLLFPQCFQKLSFSGLFKVGTVWEGVNHLPEMPILGFSNSAANKDMITKIWTNGNSVT